MAALRIHDCFVKHPMVIGNTIWDWIMTGELIELNNHATTTVESIVARLSRYVDKIDSITCIVRWDNETFDVTHNGKNIESLSHEMVLLQKYCMECADLLGDEDTNYD